MGVPSSPPCATAENLFTPVTTGSSHSWENYKKIQRPRIQNRYLVVVAAVEELDAVVVVAAVPEMVPAVAESVPAVTVGLAAAEEAVTAVLVIAVSVNAVSVFAFSCRLQDATHRQVTSSASSAGMANFFISMRLLGF